MGLDATVFCDCFERGTLKELPPCDGVYVSENGSVCCRSEDLDTLLLFDQWIWHCACDHQEGRLLHHRLGNISQVGLVRMELQREASDFAVLLTKVLYSGIHSGDYLTLADIADMKQELERLSSFVCSSQANQEYIDWFFQQMNELVEAATRIRKPISF